MISCLAFVNNPAEKRERGCRGIIYWTIGTDMIILDVPEEMNYYEITMSAG